MKNVLRVAGLLLVLSPALSAITLDSTWGDRGIVTTYGIGTEPFAIGIQPDGKVIVAMSGTLVRYDRAGQLDPTFGEEGVLTVPSSITAMALQPDGKIVLGGWVYEGTSYGFLAKRLLPDGGPDGSFGLDGSVTTSFPGVSAAASAIALQADGKMVLAGGSGTPVPPTAGDFAAIRYDSHGVLDVSFGSNGLATLDMAGVTQEIARAVIVDPNGRIVIGGYTDTSTGILCAIGALTADGQPDPTFGANGRRFISVSQFDTCQDLALTADRKVVAALTSWPEIGVYAARLTTDGSLDPTFGSAGLAKIPIEGEAAKIAVDRAGRVVVAGGYFADFVIARFLPDGRPDVTVGPGGWTQPNLGGSPPHFQANATALTVRGDGAILVAGPRSIVVIGVLAVVRYLGDVTAVPGLNVVGVAVFATLLALTGLFAVNRGR